MWAVFRQRAKRYSEVSASRHVAAGWLLDHPPGGPTGLLAVGCHHGPVIEVVAAAVGVVGALAGTILGVAIQRRHQREALIHNNQLAVYADMFIHLASTQRWIARLVGQSTEHDPARDHTPPDLGAVNGRVLLLCTPTTRQAWQEYLDALHDMRWMVSGLTDHSVPLASDGMMLLRLRAAIDDVYRLVRAEGGLKADT
jgi:hypothetical protein